MAELAVTVAAKLGSIRNNLLSAFHTSAYAIVVMVGVTSVTLVYEIAVTFAIFVETLVPVM